MFYVPRFNKNTKICEEKKLKDLFIFSTFTNSVMGISKCPYCSFSFLKIQQSFYIAASHFCTMHDIPDLISALKRYKHISCQDSGLLLFYCTVYDGSKTA